MIFKRNADKFFNPHRHFAFTPITLVDNGQVKTVWLRFVNRKLVANMMGVHWLYTL